MLLPILIIVFTLIKMICVKILGKATGQECKRPLQVDVNLLKTLLFKVPIQNQALGFYKSDLQLL